MNFAGLSIVGLAIAAAITALVVVLLYLMRPTPRPQDVSNLHFWVRAVQRSRPRLMLSRRLPILALLMTLLVSLLIVALLGDPRFGSGFQGTTVVVLDADRSMGARDRGRTRLQEALERLREVAQQDTLSGRVAVVRAGIRPRVIVPLTNRPADIERALRDFDLDDGVANLRAAVEMAQSIVRHSGNRGRVVLMSDRQIPPLATRPGVPAPAARRTDVPVVFSPVGRRGDTLAIVAFGARRAPEALGEYAVHCEVRSFAARPATAHLVVRDRNIVISDERIALAPGANHFHRATGFSSAEGEVVARLEDIRIEGTRDALASDDVAYAEVEAIVPTRVLLVSPGNRYIESALAVNPSVELERTDLEGLLRRRAQGAAGGLDGFDVVIMDRVAPDPPLEHPGLLYFAPPRAAPGLASGEELTSPAVTGYATDHRVLAGVRFDQIRVTRARPLAAFSDDRVLVRSGRDVLALAREGRGTRLVAMGFDTESTDMVQRIAFPLLMHNALMWLDHREGAYQSWQRPGEPIRVSANASSVRGPDGRAQQAYGSAMYETARAGIYHTTQGAVAVSGVEDASALVAPPEGARRPARPRGLPPLVVLIAGAVLGLLALEWLLVQRGWLP